MKNNGSFENKLRTDLEKLPFITQKQIENWIELQTLINTTRDHLKLHPIQQTPQVKHRKKVNTVIFATTMFLTVATIPIYFMPVVPMAVFTVGVVILTKRKSSGGKVLIDKE